MCRRPLEPFISTTTRVDPADVRNTDRTTPGKS